MGKKYFVLDVDEIQPGMKVSEVGKRESESFWIDISEKDALVYSQLVNDMDEPVVIILDVQLVK